MGNFQFTNKSMKNSEFKIPGLVDVLKMLGDFCVFFRVIPAHRNLPGRPALGRQVFELAYSQSSGWY